MALWPETDAEIEREKAGQVAHTYRQLNLPDDGYMTIPEMRDEIEMRRPDVMGLLKARLAAIDEFYREHRKYPDGGMKVAESERLMQKMRSTAAALKAAIKEPK